MESCLISRVVSSRGKKEKIKNKKREKREEKIKSKKKKQKGRRKDNKNKYLCHCFFTPTGSVTRFPWDIATSKHNTATVVQYW